MTTGSYVLSELAELLEGTAYGDDVTITGVGTLEQAAPGQIVFVANSALLERGEQSPASALIVPADVTRGSKPFIVTEDPRLAFSKALEIFAPVQRRYPGIHPSAVVEEGVSLGDDVSIGANAFVGQNAIIGSGVTLHPLSYVGHETSIGDGTTIYPQAFVGDRVMIGSRCIIHAGAAVGADGFGYVQTPHGHKKILQIGTVIIGDDVEIGAHVTVDRATVTATVIGSGTKVDDGVHVAHNVVLGQHCMLCGQVGIAGSAKIGDWVVMGGQAGINPHVNVCSQTVVGGGAAVISDIDTPGVYSGQPAQHHGSAMRQQAALRRLPDLLKQVKRLERQVADLTARLELEDDA